MVNSGEGPGPNSQSFKNAYVQKIPTSTQIIQPATDISISNVFKARGPNSSQPLRIENLAGDIIFFVDTAQSQVVFAVPAGSFSQFLTRLGGADMPLFSVDDQNVFGFGAFVPVIVLGADEALTSNPPAILLLSGSNPGGVGVPRPIETRGDEFRIKTADPPVQRFSVNNTGLVKIEAGSTLDLNATAILNPIGQGANVGQPTGAVGVTNQFAGGTHRHAFSGRFLGNSHTLPLGQGIGLPFNFARVKVNAAWTLRRIWVYAQTGPTGGTETYGIVNAAGALQGTSVVLPAGAGVTQAESALQVTNLTGATLYYVAQTAIGAGWAAGSINTEVGFEYTMNI
ncbi:MAG TPA: hypothetical protein VJ327_01670 [Patescibacteria group bacterium]|nr:hypothetical protein [Patescibacteria group bacterium]